MEHSAKVSVLILNWNRKDILMESLKAVKQLEYPLYNIIVVDNASTDGSQQSIKDNHPEILLIENDKNYGAIGGKNIGLHKAIELPIDYIFMVDNDIICAKDCLTQMVNTAEKDASVGLLGAMMYDLEKPDIIFSAGGVIDFTENVSRARGSGQRDVGQFSIIEEVDYLWGGALLARKKVLEEVGLFDPQYIGYWFEDTDISVRVRKANYRVLFNPHAKVWHRPHPTIEQFSFRKKYLATTNAIRFMKKHANAANWLKYLFFSLGGLPYMFIRDLFLCRGVQAVHGKARGLIDGVLGREDQIMRFLHSKKT